MSNNYPYKFTVFTPCYNSEKLIKRIFDYLQIQTFTDFEWIVIDDISTDNTVKIVESLIPQANFPIQLMVNETNQMVNKNQDIALENAKGEFFIKLSHDDYIPKDGLQNFYDTWQSLTDKQRAELYGVVLNCCDIDGKLEGDKFPKDTVISDAYEMRFSWKTKGEKCAAQRTDLMKEFPFHHPNIDVYVPADLHFYTLDNQYQSVFANKIGVAHIVNEGKHVHLEDQIGRGKKYTKGISYWFENMVNDLHWKVWKHSKRHHFLFLTNFIRYARYNGDAYSDIIKRIKYKRFLIPFAILAGNLNELYQYKTIL